jgi:GT2 family glycosyltransferase
MNLDKKDYDVTASIVTYINNENILKKTIKSFLASIGISIKLYVIDNSPDRNIENLCKDEKIEYIFTEKNIGFGAAHNLVLKNQNKLGKYHLVLNPDVYFGPDVINKIFLYMEKNSNIGLLMPKVIYPNGNIQYLAKLLPTPRDWIFRRFLSFLPSTRKRDEYFELRFSEYNKILKVPYLSGCFMFIHSVVLKEIGIFDEGIFMYGEDTDLTRRIYKKYDTVFYPDATITHQFQKESHKNLRLLWIHIKAAIYYFNKWGWFFDKERKRINREVLSQLNKTA